MQLTQPNFCLAEWKLLAEIIAFLSAAAFFVYKLFSGYLITNISIKLSCRRQRSANIDRDHLVIIASLKKGDRGSVDIHDAQARVSYNGGESQTIQLIGFERLSFTIGRIGSTERKILNWNERSRQAPFIRLSPDEEVEFSCLCDIPHSSACIVEVAIIGKRLRSSRTGQWRASLVSLPISNSADSSQ